LYDMSRKSIGIILSNVCFSLAIKACIDNFGKEFEQT
jgi:hypothetical protein